MADAGKTGPQSLSLRNPKLRKLVIVGSAVAIAAVLAFSLLVPLTTTYARTVATTDPCMGEPPDGGVEVCTPQPVLFSVGDGRTSQLVLSWSTTVTAGVVITVSTGSTMAPGCILCDGTVVYSSPPGASAGSFSAAGPGPFYFWVSAEVHGNQSTTFSGWLSAPLL